MPPGGRREARRPRGWSFDKKIAVNSIDRNKHVVTKVKHIARIFVQALSALLALVGLFWIYCGLLFLFETVIRHSISLGLSSIFFIGIGAVCAGVSYQVIAHYSRSSISNLTAIAGFFIYTTVTQITRTYWLDSWNGKDFKLQLILVATPVIIAWICYRVLKWLLIKMTLEDRIVIKDVEHVPPGGRGEAPRP